MSEGKSSAEKQLTPAGWQGITVEIPNDWHISAISGDRKGGYMRFDDEMMPRLEVKWASEGSFVNLDEVVSKYLDDLQKGRKKEGAGEVKVDRKAKLLSKRKRRKQGLKCFRWEAKEAQGFGAAWTCRDCGRTMIAQVMCERDGRKDAEEEFAAAVLLGIEDHPKGDWLLWSAYGMDCRIPGDFELSGQKLMAGLIQHEFGKETEKLTIARWGMANVALKKRTLESWLGSEMGKSFRKHKAEPEVVEIRGHEAVEVRGGMLAGVQPLQRFYAHCTGKLYADTLIAKAWHCEPTNRIYYVETFVDRATSGLADQLVQRIECHPGSGAGEEVESADDE